MNTETRVPCHLRAKPGEPIFTLLGRDKAAAQTIRFWCLERLKRGMNRATDAQIVDAYALANEINAYCNVEKAPSAADIAAKMEEAGSDLI